MSSKPWIISVDLDGYLAKPISSEHYANAQPIMETIAKINRLYDAGHRIMIHTARGWYLYDITIKWLVQHGVKYTSLVMGKLYAHAYLDDMNRNIDELMEKII